MLLIPNQSIILFNSSLHNDSVFPKPRLTSSSPNFKAGATVHSTSIPVNPDTGQDFFRAIVYIQGPGIFSASLCEHSRVKIASATLTLKYLRFLDILT